MALFKIFKGNVEDLSLIPIKEGYAYFTEDEGCFYVDLANERKKIDARYAEGLKSKYKDLTEIIYISEYPFENKNQSYFSDLRVEDGFVFDDTSFSANKFQWQFNGDSVNSCSMKCETTGWYSCSFAGEVHFSLNPTEVGNKTTGNFIISKTHNNIESNILLIPFSYSITGEEEYNSGIAKTDLTEKIFYLEKGDRLNFSLNIEHQGNFMSFTKQIGTFSLFTKNSYSYIEVDENEGIIFNDPKNNNAYSINSNVFGGKNTSGGRGFKIINSSGVENQEGYYTIACDNPDSLQQIIGTLFSVRGNAENYNNLGKVNKITKMYADRIRVEVDTYKPITLSGAKDNPENFVAEEYLTFTEFPELGNMEIGYNAFSTGSGNIASNRDSFATGRDNRAIGEYAFVAGRQNVAGYAAHAEGRQNQSLGGCSHTEGRQNIASGEFGAHAEGYANIAEGVSSHAEGRETKALGNTAHAEGYQTTALNDYTHAEGGGSRAEGIYSHAEGQLTVSSGDVSHAEGRSSKATNLAAHAEGFFSEASGTYAHSEGVYTIASGDDGSHAEGYKTTASGAGSHAQNSQTQATGIESHAEGLSTLAQGRTSHAEGHNSKAIGLVSHAEGSDTTALGNYSHAEGKSVVAEGDYSHAEGWLTVSKGMGSHAEGEGTQAINSNSHAEGYSTISSGINSHAEGELTISGGRNSHAEGCGTVASGAEQHVQGRYNLQDENYAHIVGNGTSDSARDNAHTLDWFGNAWFAGNVTVGEGIELARVDLSNAPFKTTKIIQGVFGTIFSDDATFMFKIPCESPQQPTLLTITHPNGYFGAFAPRRKLDSGVFFVPTVGIESLLINNNLEPVFDGRLQLSLSSDEIGILVTENFGLKQEATGYNYTLYYY